MTTMTKAGAIRSASVREEVVSPDEEVVSPDDLSPDGFGDADRSDLLELVADPAPEAADVGSDPLARYMAELRGYPLLDRDEEHALAVRYAANHDPETGRRLLTANLRLVVKLAGEFRHARQHLLDLVQEGNVGLVRSLEKYDPNRGVRLSTYAAWWIRAYMLKFILDNSRLVRFGKTELQRKLFFNLRKEQRKLEALGIVATPAAVAASLKVPESAVTAMQQRLGQPELSLDAPASSDDRDGRTQLDQFEAAPAWRPDVAAESREFRSRLREVLDAFGLTLEGREKVIFAERLLSDPPKTLQTLADRFGVSRERTRQIEAKLLDKLKVSLRHELGDVVETGYARAA